MTFPRLPRLFLTLIVAFLAGCSKQPSSPAGAAAAPAKIKLGYLV